MKKLLTLLLCVSICVASMTLFAGCAKSGSIDGVMYEISAGDSFAKVVGYEGTGTEITIVDEFEGRPVTEIADEAFRFNEQITSVVIPDSVTSIGKHAFGDCTSLTSVSFGSGLDYIGVCAFSGCYGLTSITLPDNLRHIDASAFMLCTGIESVTLGNVYTISSSAFMSCKNLSSITLPEGLNKIDNSAFEDCTALTSINIPASVTRIGTGAFKDCSKLQSVYFANTQGWEYNNEYGVAQSVAAGGLADPARAVEYLTDYCVEHSLTRK